MARDSPARIDSQVLFCHTILISAMYVNLDLFLLQFIIYFYTLIGRYHVYVDGFLKTTVRASDKTRALVEGK